MTKSIIKKVRFENVTVKKAPTKKLAVAKKTVAPTKKPSSVDKSKALNKPVKKTAKKGFNWLVALLVVIVVVIALLLVGNLVWPRVVVNAANTPAGTATANLPATVPTVTSAAATSTQAPKPEVKSTEAPKANEVVQPVGSVVQIKSSINQESSWLIAEPGVLLDATATFDRGSSEQPHEIQIPEGGFSYLSAGKGKVTIEKFTFDLIEAKSTNNLVLIKGIMDDKTRLDLNKTVLFTGYKPGHIITSPMPQGAYVSANWLMDQLKVSAGQVGQTGGDCGASGCETTYIHLYDLNSGVYQLFKVLSSDIGKWVVVK